MAGGAAAVGSAAGAGAPFGVSISDVPSPADPYLVDFNVTVASGIPTGYNWSFGDGQYSNGSGPGYAAPSHRFPGPGTFNVVATVAEGNLIASQTLPVSIVATALRVGVSLHPVGTTDQRTFSFSASILGGTGSYRSVLWDFGDGGTGSGLTIQYTYQHPGSYRVSVNVTDSSGRSTGAQASVTAGGASPPAPSGSAPPIVTSVIVSLAVAGLLAAAVASTRWLDRRSLRRASIEQPPPSPESTPPEPSAPVADGPPPAPVGPEAVAGAKPQGGESVATIPPSADADVRKVRPESLRTSQRIVVHLASLGAMTSDEVAPIGFTQKGIAATLHVSQNALTNVLRRLVSGGVLTEEVRHVHGQSRRLKVYRLTPRGEALARDLRRAPSHGAVPGSEGRP